MSSLERTARERRQGATARASPAAEDAPAPPSASAAEGQLHIGVLCFIAERAVATRVLAALAEAGFGDLTAAQGRVFARLGADGSRVSALAEQAQVSKQTAGFLVDQLEAAGYVRRTVDPSDGRARLVRLAERGHAALAVARATEAQIEAEWVEHLGARTFAQLREALTRLREVTDPYR